MGKELKSKKLPNFKFIVFIFSLSVIFVLVILNISVANPESQPFYNFKRLSEKVQLSLKSNPKDKVNYQLKLLDKRLAELTFIVEKGISSYVLTTSLRYSTTAGQITEQIIQSGLKDELQKAKEKFEAHLLIVNDLPQKYPKDDEEIKYIIDDTNYLKIYINLLSSLSSNQ